MSYNIQYGGGGPNIQAILAAIRAENADIVALQEVDVNWMERSAFQDQGRILADSLRMQLRYAPIYSIPDSAAGRLRQFGVALLSRYPVVRFVNHSITRLSTQSDNPVPTVMPGFLEATVNVAGTHVRIFNTHLDFRRDPAVRIRQVDDMLAIIGDSPMPTLLFGDLNATPDAAELQPLLRKLPQAWPSSSAPGLTVPVGDPARQIDYVLASGPVRVRKGWVPETRASDHRPIVVEVSVSKGRQ